MNQDVLNKLLTASVTTITIVIVVPIVVTGIENIRAGRLERKISEERLSLFRDLREGFERVDQMIINDKFNQIISED